MNNTVWVIVAFIFYACVMILIGVAHFRKTNSVSDYFLGGRTLGSWVAAISAQASDMSGWLLMGLPGAIYAAGCGQVWIAIGLCAGTALNWIFVAKRLRRYTIKAGDSITIPEYFENRFRDKSGALKVASSIFIVIFFTVYTASGFVAGAVLFSQVFGIEYQVALLIGVLLILTYTFLGGFMAVCLTDLIQGLLMLAAIFLVPVIAVVMMGGFGNATAALPDNFLNPFVNLAGESQSGISIISQLAWGLGYFGMPHIIVRFMAIKSEKAVSKSRNIALVWVVVSLSFAVVVGIVGATFLPDLNNPETVFINMVQEIFLNSGSSVFLLPVIGGLFLCGILAAIMSTADSQLLLTASSVSNDIYKGMINKSASDRFLLWFSRGAVVVVAIIAYIIAIDPDSSVMKLVSNAWSGFGSAFGAVVLLSLYWRRINRPGAIAGIISGGLAVIVWDYIPIARNASGTLVNLGAQTGLYSLVPGFALSFIVIVAVSLITAPPSSEMNNEFDAVASLNSGLE